MLYSCPGKFWHLIDPSVNIQMTKKLLSASGRTQEFMVKMNSIVALFLFVKNLQNKQDKAEVYFPTNKCWLILGATLPELGAPTHACLRQNALPFGHTFVKWPQRSSGLKHTTRQLSTSSLPLLNTYKPFLVTCLEWNFESKPPLLSATIHARNLGVLVPRSVGQDGILLLPQHAYEGTGYMKCATDL